MCVFNEGYVSGPFFTRFYLSPQLRDLDPVQKHWNYIWPNKCCSFLLSYNQSECVLSWPSSRWAECGPALALIIYSGFKRQRLWKAESLTCCKSLITTSVYFSSAQECVKAMRLILQLIQHRIIDYWKLKETTAWRRWWQKQWWTNEMKMNNQQWWNRLDYR